MALTVLHLEQGKLNDRRFRDVKFDIAYGDSAAHRAELAHSLLNDYGCYVEVAKVEGDDMNVAWNNTNNRPGLDSWSMEPARGVTVLAPLHVIDGRTYGLRSTSVGDLVRTEDGSLHLVANFGFERI